MQAAVELWRPVFRSMTVLEGRQVKLYLPGKLWQQLTRPPTNKSPKRACVTWPNLLLARPVLQWSASPKCSSALWGRIGSRSAQIGVGTSHTKQTWLRRRSRMSCPSKWTVDTCLHTLSYIVLTCVLTRCHDHGFCHVVCVAFHMTTTRTTNTRTAVDAREHNTSTAVNNHSQNNFSLKPLAVDWVGQCSV